MLAQEGHVHAGTKTVCREMSSDAECIWRATAEDVLTTAVAAGAGRPDSPSRLAGTTRNAT